jgi:hypothetical protein
MKATQTMRNQTGENNPFYGMRHTEETRQKMREAAKHRRARKKQAINIGKCYHRLIAAIVLQAVKDKAAWFFKTETGRSYCAVVGIDPYRITSQE